MPAMEQARSFNSQFGVTVTDTTGYGVGGGDAAFAVGQTIFVRFATRIPRGSVINSATLSFNVVVKNTGTTQNSTHEVRGHASDDSPILKPGVLEASRPGTSAMVPWTCSWTANPPDTGAVIGTIDIKTIMQELVNRPNFKTGGYVTLMVRCINENGSDMSVRLNNIFAPSPLLRADFTPPASDIIYTYNRCENSELNPVLEGLESIPATDYIGWGQNEFFGAFVNPANNPGTIARDATFTRLPGIPTLRFTCGTPVAANDKLNGPMATTSSILPGEWWSFAGWIYLPTPTITMTNAMVGDVYNSFQNIVGLVGAGWRPFCSPPVQNTGVNPVTRWPAVGVRPYTAGYQYRISEPTFLISPIRQMPFNGLTPDKPYIDHQSTASFMQSVRAVTPRTVMMVDGVAKKVPTWVRRSDVTTAIVEACEPVKGGPQIQQLPAGQTIGGLPAGMTVTELL